MPIPPTGAVPPHHHYPWYDSYAENPWSERRSRLVDALLSGVTPDILGFQEVLHGQLGDLAALLGEGYGYVGVGRDDGKEAGEYAPVFWRKKVFELVRWKTVWLSPEPDVPGSKGWDAVSAERSICPATGSVIGIGARDIVEASVEGLATRVGGDDKARTDSYDGGRVVSQSTLTRPVTNPDRNDCDAGNTLWRARPRREHTLR